MVKTKPKIVAIIQARVNSKRLPSKVLMDIEGQTMLERVVNRVKEAKTMDEVVVATTVSEEDNAIAKLCEEHGWFCFRGSEPDVLDRFYQVSCLFKADAIVRINADCPLVDPKVIDTVVNKFLSSYPNIDYASNVLPRTYPRGLDTEVIGIRALQSEWKTSSKWREHVTLNIRNNYERFRMVNVSNVEDYSYMRWCVDTLADLEFARKVFGYFGDGNFHFKDVLQLLEKHPDWVIRDTQKDPQYFKELDERK